LTQVVPFGQVNRDKSQTREGAGLGLPLSKPLVELHGGTFEIESTYGKGNDGAVRISKQSFRHDENAAVTQRFRSTTIILYRSIAWCARAGSLESERPLANTVHARSAFSKIFHPLPEIDVEGPATAILRV